MNIARPQPGPVALVGSGEYLPQMNEIDRMLLDSLGEGPKRVALLPTASGLELGMPERWNTMGVEHFQGLGVAATPVHLIGRTDALDAQVVAALQGADMYYFSGGNPEHVIETMHGSSAWEVIYSGWLAGAALAGCSAGAMMLGGYTLSVRSVMRGQQPRWVPALGIVPSLAIMPHFDRVADFAGEAMFRTILASAPASLTLVGIDEDTALVRKGTPGAWHWQVYGRQSVSVFDAEGRRTLYHMGETVPLRE